mgnify:CR=1 FL=1
MSSVSNDGSVGKGNLGCQPSRCSPQFVPMRPGTHFSGCGQSLDGLSVGSATGVSGGGITSEFTNVAGFSTNYAAGDLLEFVVIGTPAKITRASVTMTFEKDI